MPIKNSRLASRDEQTKKNASRPTQFAYVRQPQANYLAIPEVSSERRQYIPVGFLSPDIICSNKIQVVPSATIFHFGVLTSIMHMAWMRQICGRMKSDYSYSANLVYNNFPWPQSATDKQRASVETKAQTVLDTRQQFPDATLADLYDPLAMPPALAKAHAELDRAVDLCYRPEKFDSDRQRVEFLFALYEKLTAPLLPVTKPRRR